MMPDSQHKIANKIIGILTIFFLVALLAVSMTLWVSWKLEGGAAAINDAGSLRMRSYRIGNLLLHSDQRPDALGRLEQEVAEFSRVLDNLRRGDPQRPLAPPRDAQMAEQLEGIERDWNERMRPMLFELAHADTSQNGDQIRQSYQSFVDEFVHQIDQLVMLMERNYVLNTNLLRTLQAALILVAIVGTLILIRFFFIQVIRPVNQLHQGIKHMLDNDFSVRLPLGARDEFGALAAGFNQMVQHLQSLYATLEERVTNKTKILAERNRELNVLYETTAFLNEPLDLPEVCHGFRQRVMDAMKADACVIRLQTGDNMAMELVSHNGVSASFLSEESRVRCGECVCGDVFNSGYSQQINTLYPPSAGYRGSCLRDGFFTASAFSIVYQKNVIGVFNLYYRVEKTFSLQEMALLDTLGKHLGLAIENVRLRSREKEAAVYEERNLMAQELHDSIAQGLAYLNIQTQLLRESLKQEKTEEALVVAGNIRQGVQESYNDVRELLIHFRTRAKHADLETALLTVVQRFEIQSGIAVKFEKKIALPHVAEDEGLQILHIVQEAMFNIRKHADAQHVSLRFEQEGSHISIVIEDDGLGFDPDDRRSAKHVGLKIMQERATRIGALLQVVSRQGMGTKVILRLRHFSNPGG